MAPPAFTEAGASLVMLTSAIGCTGALERAVLLVGSGSRIELGSVTVAELVIEPRAPGNTVA